MAREARRRRARLIVAALAMLVSVGLVGAGPAAALAMPAVKAPKPGRAVSVVIEAPELVRLDRQISSSPARVVFSGVDDRTRVRVSFGDGSMQAAKGSCSVRKAARRPASCTVSIPIRYDRPGTFTITARGGTAGASHVITIADVPGRWKPQPGQVFNQGWAPLSVTQRFGSTFTFCQAVQWHFDRSGESPERTTMIDDVRAGLATLSAQTGLRFEEVDDPGAADLTFSWADLRSYGEYVAGLGGPTRLGTGGVKFSTTSEWTKDIYAGNQPVHYEWTEGNWRYWYDLQGRQALVIHEVMHVLGFDHVEDYTSIMYPQSIGNGAGQLSAGDLEGLHTMYLNQPCPLIPD